MTEYPEDDELERIKTWPHTDFPGLMTYVHSLWWSPGWSWAETKTEDEGTNYKVSTGGWSGNEELVGALKSNTMFWILCWVSSRRGGHFEFEVRP